MVLLDAAVNTPDMGVGGWILVILGIWLCVCTWRNP